MQQVQVFEQLKDYIANQVLDGKDIGLNETTPLLEWGVINSIEIMRLLGFIEKKFNVIISPEQLTADNFVNLAVITNLVLENSQSATLQNK